MATLTLDRDPSVPLATNPHLLRWVEKMRHLTGPDSVHWVDGSQQEFDALCAQMVETGTLTRLDEQAWPGCYYARSDASDVARVEQRTFVCSLSKESAGPTNNWVNPFEMRKTLRGLFKGCMAGRTMYVLAYSMGEVGSPMSQIGVQLTDSPYVVASMRIMARIGLRVLAEIDNDTKRVVPCLHSVGMPLAPGDRDVPWPCNKDKYIVHFPETREIWSYGSGYGGNALLGKKCFGLRIASAMARDEGWMAEHMLILGVEDPHGREDLRRGGVPECLRQDEPGDAGAAEGHEGLEGLDHRRRHRLDEARRRGAAAGDQSRGRHVRRRAGHVVKTNPNAMATIARNTIFTNVALTPDGGVWWEGMTETPPDECLDWQGNLWTPAIGREQGTTAAHPNARFTAPITQCPIIDPGFDDPIGVPISAIIFGGRRATTMPLVYQAFNWTSRASTWARRWARRRPPRRPARSARCGATRWPCCRSAATTWATTSGTGSRCSAR